MKKRTILPLILGVSLVGSAALGTMWWTSWRFHESTDDAYVHSDITAISPRIAAHVAAVLVEDNAQVRQGDVLVRLEDADWTARAEEARAAVEARRAALSNVDERLALQRAVIAQAEAELSAAGAERARAAADLVRSQELVAREFASRQRLDANTAEARKSAAGASAAAARLSAARQQLAVIESERAMAQAQLKQAEATLAAVEVDLANTVIRAPVDGLIGNRAVKAGQYVRPGSHLLSVVPMDRVWIEANFKETQIGGMKPGQTVAVAVDAYPGEKFEGRVESLSPASGAQFSLLPPENATGNFTKVVQRIPVRVAVPGDGPLAGRLRPGMSVVVTVDTASDSVQGVPPRTSAALADQPVASKDATGFKISEAGR